MAGAAPAAAVQDAALMAARWRRACAGDTLRRVDEPVRAWTVEEANAALAWVRGVVERAQRLWEDHRREVVRAARLVRQNGHGVVPADPSPIRSCVEELAAEGVILRDIGRGLVDFPARAPSGRWYWLCWLPGEEAVSWWHWPEEGFLGRRRLDDPPT